jgi:hypothetical protein
MHAKEKIGFFPCFYFLGFNFNSLLAIENVGTSMCRGNTEIIQCFQGKRLAITAKLTIMSAQCFKRVD